MSAQLQLVMIEEDADELGTPLQYPRRIVELTQDGSTTVYLTPHYGEPIVTLTKRSLSPKEFEELWAKHGGNL